MIEEPRWSGMALKDGQSTVWRSIALDGSQQAYNTASLSIPHTVATQPPTCTVSVVPCCLGMMSAVMVKVESLADRTPARMPHDSMFFCKPHGSACT